MKVGVLTFQQADNFGAALQAYALVRYLQCLGYDAEIINYHSSILAEKYSDVNMIASEEFFSWKKMLRVLLSKPLLRRRKSKFSEFRKEMSISKRVYIKEDLERINDVYDAFIAGSDQIWNYEIQGADTTYLLDFIKDNNKKMSYASSFGLERIDDSMRPVYAQYLSDIPLLSVREEQARRIVLELIGRAPEVVLDPCLLLTADEWKRKTVPHRLIKKPYVVIYMFTGQNFDKILVESNLNVDDYTIVKINGNITYDDFLDPKTKVRFAIGPKEFLNLILHADLVLTDSFHGTVFSVIFRKRFVTVLRESSGKNARITDFLTPIGLENRVFRPRMRAEQILQEPDYESVFSLLEPRIRASHMFLKESLEKLESGNVK